MNIPPTISHLIHVLLLLSLIALCKCTTSIGAADSAKPPSDKSNDKRNYLVTSWRWAPGGQHQANNDDDNTKAEAYRKFVSYVKNRQKPTDTERDESVERFSSWKTAGTANFFPTLGKRSSDERPNYVFDSDDDNMAIVEEAEQNIEKRLYGVKKDVFRSRGWGAGGMPFSVLYLNKEAMPHRGRSIKSEQQEFQQQPHVAALTDQKIFAVPVVETISMPQRQSDGQQFVAPSRPGYSKFRGPNNGGSKLRKPVSVIPHLFVSYGWGPMG